MRIRCLEALDRILVAKQPAQQNVGLTLDRLAFTCQCKSCRRYLLKARMVGGHTSPPWNTTMDQYVPSSKELLNGASKIATCAFDRQTHKMQQTFCLISVNQVRRDNYNGWYQKKRAMNIHP